MFHLPFTLASAVLSFECILAGSCQIALVLQPYRERVKPEFREKWSDIVNQVLRLRPCLQPKKGLDQTPQGGYTPLISKSIPD